MPAQGQKSWDTATRFQESFRRLSQCLPRGRNPGTTGKARARCGRASSQCLPRGRNPGTRCRQQVAASLRDIAMPAQGQKSWDVRRMLERRRKGDAIAMPAQGQKSWDSLPPDGGGVPPRIAMPAQGQKSWDDWRRICYPPTLYRSQCLPRGRNPGTSRSARWSSRASRNRNACPGAEILGRLALGQGLHDRGPSQCLPRGRNPGTGMRCARHGTHTRRSQCLPRGRNPGTWLY